MPSPGSLIFNATTGQGNPTNQTITFSSSDNTLNLAIAASSNSSWLKVLASSNAFATIGVDQTGLATGVYNGIIAVTQSGASNSPVNIPVVLVNGGGSGGGSGTLTLSPSSISLSSTSGSLMPSTSLDVSATNATSFGTSIISYSSNGSGWLTVSPSFGTTFSRLSVSASPTGLATGTYTASIQFNANGSLQYVPVTFTVNSSSGGNTGNVTVSQTSLTFTAQQGASPAAQNISVSSASGSAGVTFHSCPDYYQRRQLAFH